MKFNLKNRPIPRSQFKVGGIKIQCYNYCEEWFEGFEKELREILKKLGSREEQWDEMPEIILCDLIEEILGDA